MSDLAFHDREQGVEQIFELARTIAIGASQDRRERDTLSFGDEVVC